VIYSLIGLWVEVTDRKYTHVITEYRDIFSRDVAWRKIGVTAQHQPTAQTLEPRVTAAYRHVSDCALATYIYTWQVRKV